MHRTMIRFALLSAGIAAAGTASALETWSGTTTRCYSTTFDGECANATFAESLVTSEGQTYLDHAACVDDTGAKMDDCLEIRLEKATGAIWTHRIEANACVESTSTTKADAGSFQDCYAGYDFIGKTRHKSEFYMGAEGYSLVDSQIHYKTTMFGWDKFLRTDTVTSQTGWNVSSGISTDISVVVTDGAGAIVDSEYTGWSLIAAGDGSTPTITEKCGAARDRMINTGPDVTDALLAICDYFEIDEGGVAGFFSNSSVLCDSLGDANEKLTTEAASVFYDECLSHPNEFFPELYGPAESTTDPMFDYADPVFLDADNVNSCAEASFSVPYTAYLQDEDTGETWTCEGTADAECGTLNTGACGCVYTFQDTPTCTTVTVDG